MSPTKDYIKCMQMQFQDKTKNQRNTGNREKNQYEDEDNG